MMTTNDTHRSDKLIKNGQRALWFVAGLSAFYCVMVIREACQTEQIDRLLPDLLHFILFAFGFSLLAIASKSGSYKPELIGAVALAVAILLTLSDSLLGESLHWNNIFLFVRGNFLRGIFLYMLIQSVRARKAISEEHPDPIPTPWYTWVAVVFLSVSLLSSSIGAVWVRSLEKRTPNKQIQDISANAQNPDL